MGSNSVRNITYILILGLVGGLVYLVGKKVNQSKLASTSTIESTTTTQTNVVSDTTYNLGTNLSPAASAHFDSSSNSLDGKVVSSSSPKSYDTKRSKKITKTTTTNALMDDNSLSLAEPTTATASGTAVKVSSKGIHKKITGVRGKGVKKMPAKKFNAGEKGDFSVIAGSFASPDNANAFVAKLKKMGFTKATTTRLDNSSNVHVIAGKYEYKGGAEAAIRTLKASKIPAYIKKKSSDLYKAETVSSIGSRAN